MNLILLFSLFYQLTLGTSIQFNYPTPDDGDLVYLGQLELESKVVTSSEVSSSYFILNNSLVFYQNMEGDPPFGASHYEDLEIRDGLFGKAVYLNGNTSIFGYENFDLVGESSITVSMRFNVSDKLKLFPEGGQLSYNNLISHWEKGGWLLRVLNNGYLRMYPRDSLTTYYSSVHIPKVINFNQAYHVVFQFNEYEHNNTFTSNLTVYVDGEKIMENYDVGHLVGGALSLLRVGYWTSTPIRCTYGLVDDVMIFTRKISEEEVKCLYNSSLNTVNNIKYEIPVNESLTFSSCVNDIYGQRFCTESRTVYYTDIEEYSSSSNIISSSSSSDSSTSSIESSSYDFLYISIAVVSVTLIVLILMILISFVVLLIVKLVRKKKNDVKLKDHNYRNYDKYYEKKY